MQDKDNKTMVNAGTKAAQQHHRITDANTVTSEIIRLSAEGHSRRAIAAQLGVTEHQVRKTLAAVTDAQEAVTEAAQAPQREIEQENLLGKIKSMIVRLGAEGRPVPEIMALTGMPQAFVAAVLNDADVVGSPAWERERAAQFARVKAKAEKVDPAAVEVERLRQQVAQLSQAISQLSAPKADTKATAAKAAERIRRDNHDYDAEPQAEQLQRKSKLVRIEGAQISSRPIKVLAIGDMHDSPMIADKSRAALIGHHAAAWRPDHIVQIGDAADMSSVCHHVKDDTYRARMKATIDEDLAAFDEFWTALNEPIKGMPIKRHMTLGNHENWLWTWEDEHPASYGVHTGRFLDILERHGWTYTEFGAWYYLGGVGFTHVPLNVMARPVGGVNAERTVWQNTVHDVVFGHSHRFAQYSYGKFGVDNKVTVINTGSAMPEGYVADYARNTQGNSLDYCVVELVIRDGHIVRATKVPLHELEHSYSHLLY